MIVSIKSENRNRMRKPFVPPQRVNEAMKSDFSGHVKTLFVR